MTCPTDAVFRSTDGRFRLFIGADPLAHILDLCLASYPLETGGVLIGHYNEKEYYLGERWIPRS